MKKILLILLVICAGFAVNAQYPGYTKISSRYNWLAGLFDGLGIPAGGNAAFQTGQAQRAGALYYDSTGVDSGLYYYSGLAWRKVPSSIGGENIYNIDGSLTSNRTLTMDGFSLQFGAFSNYFLYLAAPVNSEVAILRAYNATGGSNTARFEANTSNTTATTTMRTEFNGSKIAQIVGASDSDSTNFTYFADRHFFDVSGVPVTTDSAVNNVAILDRITGRLRSMRIDELANFIGGSTPTLQSVLDAGNTSTTNAFFDNGARVIFDWYATPGAVGFNSGTSQPAAKLNTWEGSLLYDSSIAFRPAGGTGLFHIDGSLITAAANRRLKLPDADGTIALTSDITGFVPTSRTISTTSPITGGGDLSANRTIAINNAAADGSTKGAASFTANDFDASSGNISIDYTNGQAASGSTKGFLTSADWTTFNNKTSTSRNINTTSPITGGGDLSADRTIAINNAAADGSTKGAASFGANDFDASSGNITIDYTNGPAARSLNNLASVAISTPLLPNADNSVDFGSSSFGWKDAYARRVLMKGSTSGTAEIKSDALSNTLTGTTLSGTGPIPTHYAVWVRSDETLANSNTDQDLFTNSAHNTFTVLANTTYFFTTQFDLSHGAVSHSLSFGMTPTTATVTNIAYNAMVWTTAIGTQTNTQSSNRIKATTTTTVQAAGAVNVESVEISGWFTIGATGGTITPQIKFSADPTGTVLLKTGSYFRIWVTGNDTVSENGPWN